MSAPLIHPTAIIDSSAELAPDVRVGPFAVIGRAVRIGAGSVVGGHATLEGPADLGANNTFHPYCSVGGPPQDKKYRGEDTWLRMGDGNTVRENVTINRGTVQDRGETLIGHDNWIMAGVHIAHDCVLGNHIILANTVNIAGHVRIDDWAVLGGYAGVHQFCKVGGHAMIGAASTVLQDVPPFTMIMGSPVAAHGINVEGLRRRGFTPAQIALIRRAYKVLYRSALRLEEAREALRALQEDDPEGDVLAPLTTFLGEVTRGIVR